MMTQATQPVTAASLLTQSTRALDGTSPTPRLDAEVLILHACGMNRDQLITRGKQVLTNDQCSAVQRLIERRRHGEPIAYLTGVREFWSLELNVSPATLIPRPETELLVEKALELIPHDATWSLADLGTGSGAIAIALAKERPECHVTATDNSTAALDIARSNAGKFSLANITFAEGNWFAPLSGKSFDVIVCNPPYVASNDRHLTQDDVRFEPLTALTAGADGLDAIRQLVRHARDFLNPGGHFLLEHGFDQVDSIQKLLQQQHYQDLVYHRDLAGHARVAVFRP